MSLLKKLSENVNSVDFIYVFGHILQAKFHFCLSLASPFKSKSTSDHNLQRLNINLAPHKPWTKLKMASRWRIHRYGAVTGEMFLYL